MRVCVFVRFVICILTALAAHHLFGIFHVSNVLSVSVSFTLSILVWLVRFNNEQRQTVNYFEIESKNWWIVSENWEPQQPTRTSEIRNKQKSKRMKMIMMMSLLNEMRPIEKKKKTQHNKPHGWCLCELCARAIDIGDRFDRMNHSGANLLMAVVENSHKMPLSPSKQETKMKWTFNHVTRF